MSSFRILDATSSLTGDVVNGNRFAEAEVRLVKLHTDTGDVYINPEHVVSVRKALKNTTVSTVSGTQLVIETPEEVARLLGSNDVQIDVTPRGIAAA